MKTEDGVILPSDYSFKEVNEYVHCVDRHFEELQWLALGMAAEIDKLRKKIKSLSRSDDHKEIPNTVEQALHWADKNCDPDTIKRLRSRAVVALLAKEVRDYRKILDKVLYETVYRR